MAEADLRVTAAPNLVRDQALQRLRAAIVEGQYRPGDRLIERELCERMAISRTSVREVLRQLESEELIHVEPRRGPVVATITEAAARDIYEFRALVEPEAARLFARRAPPPLVKELRRHLDGFARAVKAGRLEAMVATMAEFHAVLFHGAGNREIEAVGRRLQARISALRRASMSRPGRAPHSLAEMEALYDALRAGDAEGAAKAARRHIEAARAAALAAERAA